MKPILQALVLADKIYSDVSGKKIIAGTFNNYTIKKTVIANPQPTAEGNQVKIVPSGSDPGSPSLYVSLTDVHDGTELGLKFHNISEDRELFGRSQIKINCKDRLSTVELVLPLPALHKFAKTPGVYSLDLYWNDEIIGSHRITVQEIETPSNG